ncbi:PulJ/GspJ family protein [Thalassotalea fusca]
MVAKRKINSRKFKNTDGFTLIELMIAITILSMLLFIGSYTYRILSERWNKELGTFNQTMVESKKIALLQRLLEGIQTFVVVDRNKQPSFFFVGNEKSLLAVSRSGYHDKRFSEIFRIEPQQTADGKVTLYLQTKATSEILLLSPEQEIEFDYSEPLFTGLDKVSFRYYGWENILARSETDKKRPQWFTRYSGVERRYMPVKLSLLLERGRQKATINIDLEDDVGHWLSPYMEVDY